MAGSDILKQLKENYTPTKLSFNWWGQRRQVEKHIRHQVAQHLNAEDKSIGANKKLYSEEIPSIKAINALKAKILDWWKDQTNPYSEDGIRLLRKHDVSAFDTQCRAFVNELTQHAYAVQMDREDIIADARQRLGSAWNPSNYPADLTTLFGMEWSYPTLKPVGDLPPEIYQQQVELIKGKLMEAVAITEQAHLFQFSELIDHLQEKLSPSPDGKKKIFRDSAVENLTEFFNRFQKLNLGSNQQLDALIAEARELTAGVHPGDLRKSDLMRAQVNEGLGKIKLALTPLIVNKPRRRIVTPQGLSNGHVQATPAHAAEQPTAIAV